MKRELIFEWMNEWPLLFRKCNWYTFHPIHLEIERDMQFVGWTLTFVILGFGFHVRYNTGEETETSLKIEKQIDEALRKSSQMPDSAS